MKLGVAALLLALLAQFTPPAPPASGGSADPCDQAISAIPSGLHCKTVTLSKANILALDTTPFVLVPAPGAGNVVFPLSMRWKFTFVTTRYAGACTSGQFVDPWWQNNVNPFGYFQPQGASGAAANVPNFARQDSTVANYVTGMSPNSVIGDVPADPAAYTNQPLVLELFPSENGCLNYGPLLSVSTVTPGTGYVVGELLANNDSGVEIAVSSINGSGGVTGSTLPSTFPTGAGLQSFDTVGNITSSTKAASGAAYVMGDTFTVDGGNPFDPAQGIVDTIGAAGAVATYHLVPSASGAMSGTSYTSHSGNATTATSGIGTGLTLNIVAATGSGYTGTVVVQTGDGTLTITTWYTVAPQ